MMLFVKRFVIYLLVICCNSSMVIANIQMKGTEKNANIPKNDGMVDATRDQDQINDEQARVDQGAIPSCLLKCKDDHMVKVCKLE